jgi:hypothetical protein
LGQVLALAMKEKTKLQPKPIRLRDVTYNIARSCKPCFWLREMKRILAAAKTSTIDSKARQILSLAQD